MREFVILRLNDDVNLGENILKMLPSGSKVTVYAKEGSPEAVFEGDIDVKTRFLHEDTLSSEPKARNFISNELLGAKTEGFVHILSDSVEIMANPSVFLDEIEKMMSVFKLKSWFNTSCDGCNFVYSKYNPRLYVEIDDPEAMMTYSKTIAWCSNANTAWICYNMDRCRFEDMRFEERFRYPMYFIIEFLARRRNMKKPGQLDYMNYYPSIPEELGVFKTIDLPRTFKFTNEETSEEGRIFMEEMKVNNRPDTSVELLMDDMRAAILDYASSNMTDVEILH